MLRPMTATPPPQTTSTPRASRIAGYRLALGAGATWGTTGPLSTGLYGLMPATSIGFWRVLLGTGCLALWGLAFRRELFRADARGWLLIALGGGFLVALFEIAYQFAIAGAGVAGAAALLYTAPVMVAVLARVILKEALTPTRLLLALLVMASVALTVNGGSNAGAETARLGLGAGIARGLHSAVSYSLTTHLADFAMPQYSAVHLLFLNAVTGVAAHGTVAPPPRPPPPPPRSRRSLRRWATRGRSGGSPSRHRTRCERARARRDRDTGSSAPTTRSGPRWTPRRTRSPARRPCATPTTPPTRCTTSGCSWTRTFTKRTAVAPS